MKHSDELIRIAPRNSCAVRLSVRNRPHPTCGASQTTMTIVCTVQRAQTSNDTGYSCDRYLTSESSVAKQSVAAQTSRIAVCGTWLALRPPSINGPTRSRSSREALQKSRDRDVQAGDDGATPDAGCGRPHIQGRQQCQRPGLRVPMGRHANSDAALLLVASCVSARSANLLQRFPRACSASTAARGSADRESEDVSRRASARRAARAARG